MTPGRAMARRRDDGAAAVELALLLPILLIVVFGIVQFGFYYNATIELSGAAREGARSMAINKVTATATAAATAAAANSCAVAADPCTVSFMPAAADSCPAGQDVTVSVTRNNFSFNILFIPAVTVAVSGKAVMRCGG